MLSVALVWQGCSYKELHKQYLCPGISESIINYVNVLNCHNSESVPSFLIVHIGESSERALGMKTLHLDNPFYVPQYACLLPCLLAKKSGVETCPMMPANIQNLGPGSIVALSSEALWQLKEFATFKKSEFKNHSKKWHKLAPMKDYSHFLKTSRQLLNCLLLFGKFTLQFFDHSSCVIIRLQIQIWLKWYFFRHNLTKPIIKISKTSPFQHHHFSFSNRDWTWYHWSAIK